MECLIIRLAAPLMSWGGDQVDVTIAHNRGFPPLSMTVGMLANALGLERHEGGLHQELQDNIVIASRVDREPTLPNLIDLQTAEIGPDDQGWTTFGIPEGRTGARETYENRNMSEREYLQDAVATVAVAIRAGSPAPDVRQLAEALDKPFRTLFIGRKPCVPSDRLCVGTVDARDPLSALFASPLELTGTDQSNVRLQWTTEQSVENLPIRVNGRELTRDVRNWVSRLHTGRRTTIHGTAPLDAFQTEAEYQQ